MDFEPDRAQNKNCAFDILAKSSSKVKLPNPKNQAGILGIG